MKICLYSAVVGAGIGGTSAAYFLRQLFGSDVDIDVFESNHRICGRVANVKLGSHFYESGAAILHAKNMYCKTIAHMYGENVK